MRFDVLKRIPHTKVSELLVECIVKLQQLQPSLYAYIQYASVGNAMKYRINFGLFAEIQLFLFFSNYFLSSFEVRNMCFLS